MVSAALAMIVSTVAWFGVAPVVKESNLSSPEFRFDVALACPELDPEAIVFTVEDALYFNQGEFLLLRSLIW